MSALTVVMYHYVRQLEGTRYPAIKGLRINEFRTQLDHLQVRYSIVSMSQVVSALRGEDRLPPRAALLTFDDGYLDHYTSVFPVLFDRKLAGSFYPPVAAVKRGELLDVNRLHFILSVADPSDLKAAIDTAVRDEAGEFSLESPDDYYAKWGVANRFDTADVIYIKRMLQTVLPVALRSRLARDLFVRHVGIDEHAFARELYMDSDQIRLMIGNGMHFGSHGDSHKWLNNADPSEQEREIDQSIQYLREVGERVDDYWTMAYPYGASDPGLLKILRDRRCAVGLTTRVATADLGRDDPLLLPRYDTNDFPKS